MVDWSWSDALWETHFAPVAGQTGLVRRLSQQAFGALFRDRMCEHFPDEAFFSMEHLADGMSKSRRESTAVAIRSSHPEFFGVLEIGQEPIALFSGCAYSERAWRMWTTVVAPEHRRQGIYSRILQGHLGFSKAMGFDVVRSEHALCNNPIIIAKLRAGFQITAMEIDAEHGPSIILTYFHHPEQKRAYLYRSGMAVMTPALLASGNSAMQDLARAFEKAKKPG